MWLVSVSVMFPDKDMYNIINEVNSAYLAVFVCSKNE